VVVVVLTAAAWTGWAMPTAVTAKNATPITMVAMLAALAARVLVFMVILRECRPAPCQLCQYLSIKRAKLKNDGNDRVLKNDSEHYPNIQ
jgi:hypothetical protein